MTQAVVNTEMHFNMEPLSVYDQIDTILDNQFLDLSSMQLLLQIAANAGDRKELYLEQFLYNLQRTSGGECAFDSNVSTNRRLSSEELQWLESLDEQIFQHHKEYEFTLDRLSQLLFLSARQIRRRILRLTGLSFSQYLKKARLERAHQLLQLDKVRSIKMLANKVGMRDVKYFSKEFKAHFGQSPSALLAQ